MNKFIYAAAMALIPLSAAAEEGMMVEDAYARSANPKSGGIFMILENHGTKDCTLKSVSSDAAERVVLHSNSEVDGVMKMAEMKDGLTIPAESEHRFKRGGDHVMLMGLKEPFEDGNSIQLALDFGDCGTQEIAVPVDNQRQEDAEASDHGHDEHSDHEGHEH